MHVHTNRCNHSVCSAAKAKCPETPRSLSNLRGPHGADPRCNCAGVCVHVCVCAFSLCVHWVQTSAAAFVSISLYSALRQTSLGGSHRMSFSLARAAVSRPWLIRCLLPRELYLITSTCSCWLWLFSPCLAYSFPSLSLSLIPLSLMAVLYFIVLAQKYCICFTSFILQNRKLDIFLFLQAFTFTSMWWHLSEEKDRILWIGKFYLRRASAERSDV